MLTKEKNKLKRKFSKILGVGLTLALLTSLLLTAAPVSAIGQPTVSLVSYEISTNTSYTILFTLSKDLAAGEDIVVTFPTGTTFAAGLTAADVTLSANSGLGSSAFASKAPASIDISVVPVLRIRLAGGGAMNVENKIGRGALVEVVIAADIVSPGTIASYTLTVGTADAVPTVIEAAVASAAYTLTGPTILPLPGVVERYNSVGVLMEQTNKIQTAIGNAAAGDTINVGAGTYDEDITINQSVTITGNAATTIIKDTDTSGAGGTVTITFAGTATTGAVLDGFTIMGRPGVDALNINGTANKVTVRNCIFTKAGLATTATAQNMVNYLPTTLPTLASTITNCIFDTTLGTVVDNGILVGAGANAIGLTVSSCTFTVDGAIGLEDSAVKTSGAGTALLPITISGNTIAGASGIGVTVTVGTATVSDNIFIGLNSALVITAGTATITGNSIDNCGLVVSTTATVGKAAIGVTATTALSITNNNITNCPDDIIEIVDNSENINMMFNNLSANAIGIDNNDADTTKTLNATHNWWGAVTGPATGFNLTAGAVNDTTAYLGGEATGSFTNAAVASLLTKTTVGVDVILDVATTAGDIIGVANYSANPQDATSLPALDGGFYDIYLKEAAATVSSVLVKFYNPNITANTVIHVWGTVAGGWVPVVAVSGVNLYEGYAFATITGTTTPSIAALAGTPFALVEATPAALTAPTIVSPAPGGRDIPLTPMFAWTQIAGAAGYYFELADNANFLAPLITLDGDLARLIVTAYAYVGELPYSTAYYWRVKAVSGTVLAGSLAESPWASGVFITMDEPEEPTPPIVIEEAPTLPDITITQPDIVIESPDIIVPLPDVVETPITPAWIYIIIGVGAVLVIALLVLIVRTRRVA